MISDIEHPSDCFLFNKNEIFDSRKNPAAFYFLFYSLKDILFDLEVDDLGDVLTETSE